MNSSIILPIIILVILYFAVIALMIISLWKIFEKAGKPGWAAIVPFYNSYILVEISQKPTWWFGMLFVPFANIVFAIMIINGLSKSFGKEEAYTVGLVLLPYVFFPILAFGDSRYIYGEAETNPDLLDEI